MPGRSWPTLRDDVVHGFDGGLDVGEHPRPAGIGESPVRWEVAGQALDKAAPGADKAGAQAYEVNR